MKHTKKILSLALALIMAVSSFAGTCVTALATPTVNCTDITIYALDTVWNDILTIPDSYPQSFQLQVSGANAVSYSSCMNNSVDIDANGLVTPRSDLWYAYDNGLMSTSPMSGNLLSVERMYHYGQDVIKIATDTGTTYVNVNVVDYEEMMYNAEINRFMTEYINDSMTDYQKIDAIGRYLASFDYSVNTKPAKMLFGKGGSCYASTCLAMELAERLGFESRMRDARRDSGVGEYHVNAMIKTKDGKYYELDAGYVSKAPRYYTVEERTCLFSYELQDDNTAKVYQYDGFPFDENFVIPSTLEGRTVTAIDEDAFKLISGVKSITIPSTVKSLGKASFESCHDLESINLPQSLTTIEPLTFTDCQKLKTFYNESPNFKVIDGVIYNADVTELVYAPAVDSVTIPNTVKTIGTHSFYYNNNIKNIEIPSSVETIMDGAIADCDNLQKVVVNEGVKTIGMCAFADLENHQQIILPSSLESISPDAFLRSPTVYIYGPETGVAADFAREHGLNYNVAYVPPAQSVPPIQHKIDTYNYSYALNHDELAYADGPHEHDFDEETFDPTYTSNGYTLFTCDLCGFSYQDSVIPKLKLAIPKSVKLSGISKGIKVKYKNVDAASGYQIKYANNKKMKKAKTITVSKNKTVSKKITKLKSKKYYYVKVRSYKTVDGKKVYSSWSKAYKVKTK